MTNETIAQNIKELMDKNEMQNAIILFASVPDGEKLDVYQKLEVLNVGA